MRIAILIFAMILVAVSSAPTLAQAGHPQAVELPPIFVDTFLNFPDDSIDATRTSRRLLIYFGQDGCPYCKELIQTNFSQKPIFDKTKQHFLPVALNLWGDRETVWFDGNVRTEKQLAVFLKVQFTPTVLLLDEQGTTIARINGYYPPHKFSAALDYAAQRLERRISFSEHMRTVPQRGASAVLNEQPFLMKPPFDLRRSNGAKPLAVLFETRHCAPCDELHKDAFNREKTRAAISAFDVARFSISGVEVITTPDGRVLKAGEWARHLKISYTPTVVFFGEDGSEVFRLEAYVRPFHFTSSFEYVGSGAYKKQPEFQRFLQEKAEQLKEQGEKLDLWS